MIKVPTTHFCTKQPNYYWSISLSRFFTTLLQFDGCRNWWRGGTQAEHYESKGWIVVRSKRENMQMMVY